MAELLPVWLIFDEIRLTDSILWRKVNIERRVTVGFSPRQCLLPGAKAFNGGRIKYGRSGWDDICIWGTAKRNYSGTGDRR